MPKSKVNSLKGTLADTSIPHLEKVLAWETTQKQLVQSRILHRFYLLNYFLRNFKTPY